MGRPWVARDFNPGRRGVPHHHLLARRAAEAKGETNAEA